MAKAASRSSANTDLYIGTLKVPIGLFGTQAKLAKEQQFETAGPNGGVLRYEQRGVAKAPDETTDIGGTAPVASDPLAGVVEAQQAPLDERSEDKATSRPPLEDYIAKQRANSAADELRQWASEPGGAQQDAAVASVEGEFRQVLVEQGSDTVVESDAVRRGVRLEDGRFVDCTEQIAAIEERTKLDRIDVVATVDATRIRRLRTVGAYFVGATDKDSIEPMRLLFEGLRNRREAAIVKYTTRSRQQLGAIVADGATDTLVLLSLIFTEDIREAPGKARSIQSAQVIPERVALMERLLGELHDSPDVIDTLRDDAIALREELRARALAGEMDAEVVEPLPDEPAVDGLMDALEASLAAVGSDGN